MRDINVCIGVMPWPQTGATQYHVQSGLPDKGRAIKGLAVYNSWDLEPFNLLKRSGPRLLSTVLRGINIMKYLPFDL